MTEALTSGGLLVLPRLRVQNANAISSPMTWGFPSMTAFTGLMTALERSLGLVPSINLLAVGVICHGFEPQTTKEGFTRGFHLTRNPILQDGSTAGIVEEGRIHLDITLVFEVKTVVLGEDERIQLAQKVHSQLMRMRIAGGSVVPETQVNSKRMYKPKLVPIPADPTTWQKEFKKLSRQWLPGFALVCRDDLLQNRLAELQKSTPNATVLDAWLDLSRLNHRANRTVTTNEQTGEKTETVNWEMDKRQGWLVPIPVGYAALSDLHPPGTVANARDNRVPFRFVESVYSIGQWVSPHRLNDVDDFLWEPQFDKANGLYRCANTPTSLLTSKPI